MGLGEGAEQGPGPPAPAAADGGCGAPEPPLLRHLSRSPRVGGGKELPLPREPPPGCPWVLNTCSRAHRGDPREALPSLQKW